MLICFFFLLFMLLKYEHLFECGYSICLVCEWERTGKFVNLCKSFRDLNSRGILRVIISQWPLIWFGLKWIMKYLDSSVNLKSGPIFGTVALWLCS